MSDELELLIDLHRSGARQGPGGDEQTRTAIGLSGLRGAADLKVADVGCGTGASTFVLARELDAHVTAVDLSPVFLDALARTAARKGLADRIDTLAASMDALPLPERSLDLIWSEGAVYNIGFEHGIRTWRRFLKPGGVVAVSELTWFTRDRPAELEAHWAGEYPEVDTASAKIAVLERLGLTPIGYFPLPRHCWLEHYYRPMQARFTAFLARHGDSPTAADIVAAEEREIALYERYGAHFGYGFYLARTPSE